MRRSKRPALSRAKRALARLRRRKLSLPDGFCVLPWIGQYVSTSGAVAPCCEFDGDLSQDAAADWRGAWNGPRWHALRAELAQGQRPGACWKCTERESTEGTSMRIQKNRQWFEWVDRIIRSPRPRDAHPRAAITLDLRFSNRCNFRCRMCSHAYSSSWWSDQKRLGRRAGPAALQRAFDSFEQFSSEFASGFEALEEVYFAGGEPLLMEEHYAMLDRLLAEGRSDVILRYNTNLSILDWREVSVLERWPAFDSVFVEASIEAAGERGELIRKGFDWRRFVDNVRRVRASCPRVRIGFGVTVSALNVAALDELIIALCDECGAMPNDIQLHPLQQPNDLRAQVLPAELKHEISSRLDDFAEQLPSRFGVRGSRVRRLQDRIRGVLTHMNAESREHEFGNLLRSQLALDSLRGEHLAEFAPELRPWLERAHADVE